MFPKLKFTLFSVVLKNVDNGVNDHIRLLLRDSQLTIFSCIYEFLRSPIKTMAHLCPTVVQQGLSWHAIFSDMEQTYGDLWHYYKLFEPNSARTAQANCPVLARAAWMFAVAVMGKAGMSNAKANRASMTYLKTKLAQRIPVGFLVGQEAALAQEMNAALREFMGIRENFQDVIPEDIDEATIHAAEALMADVRRERRWKKPPNEIFFDTYPLTEEDEDILWHAATRYLKGIAPKRQHEEEDPQQALAQKMVNRNASFRNIIAAVAEYMPL